MTPTPSFCTRCGSQLLPDARFCGSCGAAVQALPPAPVPPQPMPVPVPPQPMPAPVPAAEAVLGVIPGIVRPKGPMGMAADSYTLVITSQRIIFAAYTSRVAGDAVRRAREQAKKEGKGFFGQWGSQMSSTGMEHYLSMHPDAILAEEKGSFFVPLDQIRQVRYRTDNNDESVQVIDEVEFDTVNGKISLRTKMLRASQVREVLRQALGGMAG